MNGSYSTVWQIDKTEQLLRRALALNGSSADSWTRLGILLDQVNVQRFRGGLVFQAHRLCVSLNSRLESNKEEEKRPGKSGITSISLALPE